MKKLLLSIGLLTSAFLNAQDNWINIVPYGFGNQETFRFTQTFQNKIYVAADAGGSIELFSSLTGDTNSYHQETGLTPVLQTGGNENSLMSGTANGSYMFLGSQTYYDTTGGVQGTTPQVYRYNGTQYLKHGTINYSTLPSANSLVSGTYPGISALALYSPTGSNDTIYAFANASSANNISVWKAPAGATNPTWINASNLGVTDVYDAKVWHKKLYVAVNSTALGGMILRTKDGVNWDTVVTAYSLQASIGSGYYSNYFRALEVYNDTLVAGLGNTQQALWYTADSLVTNQTWKSLIDSASYGNITNNWFDITDLQVGNGKLWVNVNYSNINPQVYFCYRNAIGKDTLLQSTWNTGVESGTNNYAECRLSYFNNAVYFSDNNAMASLRKNKNNERNSYPPNNPTGAQFNVGNIYRFTTVNPTPSFVDSATAGAGFCPFNTINFTSTSLNTASCDWYINGVYYNSGLVVSYSPNGPETDTVKMIAYNGTNQSIYKDSITHIITIHTNPVVDSVKASLGTVCQGQPDTLKSYVQGGKAPYTFDWYNSYDNLDYIGDSATVVTLYTVPSFSPYVYMSVTVTDSNNCHGYGSNPLMIYVNPADSLSGIISDTLLNPVTAGQVYLFKKKINNVGNADSTSYYTLGANGAYYFPSLYYGDYYVKAVADTNNPLYKTSVGTYYSNKPNAYQWDSALIIQHHTCMGGNDPGNNIKIIQIPNAPSGPGTITGSVSEGPGYGMRYVNNTGYAPMGAPLKGVDVKLGKNPGGNAAARTTTDNNGNYTFQNVPLGSYKIYVDIPNFGMDSVRAVVLSPSDSLSVHNDYFVDSTMVRVVPTYSATTAICQGDSIKLSGLYQHNAGIYYDTLTAVGGYDSLIITNLSITPLPTVTVTASTYTVCSGSNVILTATGTTSYLWSANAGSVTTATASVNPTANSTYTITGTSNSCSDKKTVSIVVNPLPNITASASLDTVCLGGSVTLVAGGATTYTWTNGVTNWISFVPNATNTYTVTGTGAFNCVNTATITVVVNTCAGIRQVASLGSLNVYPIPAQNSLFIEVEKNAQIKILDITGQVVLEQSVSAGTNQINISSLASGAYDLVLTASGQSTYVKVMVNK